MNLDGSPSHGADAQNLQGRARGGLFTLLDGVAHAPADLPAVHRYSRREVRAMRRPVLCLNPVNRPMALGLQRLLQERLPVPKLVGVDLGGVEDLVYRPANELFIYEIRSPD